MTLNTANGQKNGQTNGQTPRGKQLSREEALVRWGEAAMLELLGYERGVYRPLEERLMRMEETPRQNMQPGSCDAPGVDDTLLQEIEVRHVVDGLWDEAPPPAADMRGRAKYRLTLDDTGNITYHGITGWDPGQDVPSSEWCLATSSQHSHTADFPLPAYPFPSLLESVSQNQALTPIFQALATSKHISVAPELGDALLNAYHCYQVFEITSRAPFLRDMVLGGPCFSEFLLMVLYACASRMIDGLTEEQKLAQGDLFVKLAKAYLAKEMEGPTKITTIQGLLLLSGRECALGDISQGWNHAGLLGIHHAPESVSGVTNLSVEEQATRDRLFWAAFIWDKALSLALGREPTFQPRPGGDPSTIPDFDDDNEHWIPYFMHPLNCPLVLQGYVYPQSSRVVTFRLLARLCMIVHDIIMGLYSSESRDNVPKIRARFVGETRKRLDALWDDVPSLMKAGPPQPSPPPHIFGFLMLFRASYILLHRPTITASDIATVSGPAGICLQHSQLATQVAINFSQTFDERISSVPRYSWFVAASFDVVLLDSKVPDAQREALERLSVWLRIMDKNLVRAPSIRRSVQHISGLVRHVLERNTVLAMSEAGRSIEAHFAKQRGVHATPILDNILAGTESFDFFDLLQTE
ncbi:hypothetical protein JCM24511_05290 [Saitozyma sp. JCM 24511]|nr:hypothetical protein JCM24511_05290 [Saitozyma sp. JCM 24511]